MEKHKQHPFLAFAILVVVGQALLLKVKTMIRRKKIHLARELLDDILSDPSVQHADLFYLSGEVFRLLGLYEEAQNHLIEALKFNVHPPYVYNSLGQVERELNNIPRSISLFKHFVHLIETPESHFQLGELLY